MGIPLLIAMLGFAAMQSAASAQQAQNGVIRVTVREQSTSEPIAGVQLTLRGPIVTAPPPPPAPATTSPILQRRSGAVGGVAAAVTAQLGTTQTVLNLPTLASTTAVTDQNGAASFDHLAPGQYSVQAQRDGYLGVLLPTLINPNGTPFGPTSTSSMVVLGPQQPQDVSMLLVRGATISGRVRDAHGAPMPSAGVYVGVLGYRDGRRSLLSGPSAQADSQGNYRLSLLGPGEYYVCLEPSSSSLRGFGAYYPGVMDIEKSTPISIRGGEEVVGMDFDMPSIPTFKISGIVLNAPARTLANGQPDTAIPLFTFASAEPKSVESATVPQVINALRGSDGRFEISGFPAGVWDIFPVISIRNVLAGGRLAPTAPGMPLYATGRARVVVTDRDVDGVTIVVGSSDLKGRVVIPGASAAGVTPSQSIRISLLPRENIPSPLVSHVRTAQTLDANGAFTFESVPPGKYSLQFLPTSFSGVVASTARELYLKDLRIGSRSIDDGIIDVGTEPREPIEVILSSGVGSIVVSGDLPANASIVLTLAPARRQNPLLYKSTISYGSYAFLEAPPGEYKVFAWESPPAGGEEQDPQFIAKYEEFGTPVTVTESEVSRVTVKVIPADK